MEIILLLILFYNYVMSTLHNYNMTSLTIATTNQFEVTCGALILWLYIQAMMIQCNDLDVFVEFKPINVLKKGLPKWSTISIVSLTIRVCEYRRQSNARSLLLIFSHVIVFVILTMCWL